MNKISEGILEKKLPFVEEQIEILANAKTAVILDLETTGLSIKSFAEIIEIGAMRINFETKESLETFSTFVKPRNVKNLPKKIVDLTHITDDMVKDAPFIEDILPSLYNFFGDELIICHNAPFDWIRFILPIMSTGGFICTNEVICSLAIARRNFPQLKSHKLSAICEQYGIKQENCHRAKDDAMFTAIICDLMKADILKSHREIPLQTYNNDYTKKSISFMEKSELKIYNARPYTAKTNGLGNFIYFNTSVGTAVYSLSQNVLKFHELKSDKNVSLPLLKTVILEKFGVSSLTEIWDLL